MKFIIPVICFIAMIGFFLAGRAGLLSQAQALYASAGTMTVFVVWTIARLARVLR